MKSKNEINEISQTIRTKLNSMLGEQKDRRFLKTKALPIVPIVYPGPVITHNDMGKNQIICGNDSHNKATNNGFSRNKLGGFFSH